MLGQHVPRCLSDRHFAHVVALDVRLDDVLRVANEPTSLACYSCTPDLNRQVQPVILSTVLFSFLQTKRALQELVAPEVDAPTWHVSQQ